MTGEKTSVHKSLLSAGDVTDKGHALWLDGNVGYIIQKDSPILTAMRTKEFASNIHGMEPLICRKNVEYTISTSRWQAAMATLGKQLMSVPMKMDVAESGHRASGCLRPVNP